MARGQDAPLHFRGTPLALSALLPPGEGDGARLVAHPVAIPYGTSAFVHQPVMSAMDTGIGQVVRFHLPRHTPPGRYEGTAEVDGKERAVVYEVEPEAFLRLVPERLVLQAAAGARVTRELTLLNLGNTGVDVRGAYVLGLYDVEGVERAVARTFGDEQGEVAGAADRLVGRLAEEHGGMVRIKVDEGSGLVRPGESRALSIVLALPDRLQPGHTYWGTWSLEYLQYYVRIHVTREGANKEKSR